MAAAEYYIGAPDEEETLNVQSRDIAQRTLLFQAQSRGFLVRNRFYGCVWHSNSAKIHNYENIHDFPNKVVSEKVDTNTDQINSYNIRKNIPNSQKNRLYPLIPCQEETFGEAKGIEGRAQCPEQVESLNDHRESGNDYV